MNETDNRPVGSLDGRDDAALVLVELEREPLGEVDITALLRWPSARAHAALIRLEVAGVVHAVGGLYYARTRTKRAN